MTPLRCLEKLGTKYPATQHRTPEKLTHQENCLPLPPMVIEVIIIIIIIIIIESICRLCKQHEETNDHLTSGCHILAKNGYLMSHDKVCTHLHYSICKALGTETINKWYTHMPKPVCEEGDVTVLWNQAVHTQREKLQQTDQI